MSGAQFLGGVSCPKNMWNIILICQITHIVRFLTLRKMWWFRLWKIGRRKNLDGAGL